MNLTTGQVKASADVVQKVDEIAYDPGVKVVYCASGTELFPWFRSTQIN